MKKIFIILIILCSGIGLFFALSLLKKSPPKKDGDMLRTLRTAPLVREDITPKLEEFAVVTSLQEISIKSEVNGKVIHCSNITEDGVLVKKGDILIEIDKSDYNIAKQEAEAALAILKADAEQMKQNIKDLTDMLETSKEDYELEKVNSKRIKDLFEKSVYSKNELEKSMQLLYQKKNKHIAAGNVLSKQKFMLEATLAKIKQADAMLDKAKLNIRRSTIKAPISGRIINCNIEEGEYLNVGEKICTVVNDAQLSLKVPVNTDEALKVLKIYPGKTSWLRAPKNIDVTIQWLRNPDSCKWDAKIARIENYNRKTDTISILVVPVKYCGSSDSSYPLMPGMFCKVTFSGKPLKGAFQIPFSALQFNDNVYTVDQDSILHRYTVKVFAVNDDQVIILAGLPENQSVVIQQLPRGLAEGMKIKAMNVENHTAENR